MASCELQSCCDWLKAAASSSTTHTHTHTHTHKIEDTLDTHSMAPSSLAFHRVARRDIETQQSFLPSMKATT